MIWRFCIVLGIDWNLYWIKSLELTTRNTITMPPAPKRSRKLGGEIMTAKYRASEPKFKDVYYADGNKLFCHFCNHSVEWRKRDTCLDHLKSKKHLTAKGAAGGKAPKLKQSTLTGPRMTTSMQDRREFQEDFVRMMTSANIPLEKVTLMKPFMIKHCRQGGSLTNPANLRDTYLPRVFAAHFAALKQELAGKVVSVIVDETTDHRDKSVLNIIVAHLDKLYLIDVIFLVECNARTLSQHVIKSLTTYGIEYDNVCSFVSDNAAYCKAAFNILTNILPNAIQVGCMAHILNLAGEDFVKGEFYREVVVFVNDLKNIFKRQPARKRRYLEHIATLTLPEGVPTRLPPEPCPTRWGTWFSAVEYHRTHLDVYESFFANEESTADQVERVRRALAEAKDRLLLKLSFIAECTPKIQFNLTNLEGNQPFAASMFNTIDGLSTYLMQGTAKVLFGDETDRCLANLTHNERSEIVEQFHASFLRAFEKLSKHIDRSTAMNFYRKCRVFDPRQVGMVPSDITRYTSIRGLESPTQDLRDEWGVYIQAAKEEHAENFDLDVYWKGMSVRTPNLARIARENIWQRTTSVDVERSFSQYKHVLTDRRESLTEQHTKQLMLLKYNGDVEGRLM